MAEPCLAEGIGFTGSTIWCRRKKGHKGPHMGGYGKRWKSNPAHGERRARTERVVNRRLRCAAAWWRKTPGKLKKRPPVCYCAMCRMARKGGSRKSEGK